LQIDRFIDTLIDTLIDGERREEREKRGKRDAERETGGGGNGSATHACKSLPLARLTFASGRSS